MSQVVYVFDFQEECALETEILKDVATVKCLNIEKLKEIPKKELAEADGLLVWHLRDVDKEVIDSLKKVKIIQRVGMGFDNVDLEAAGKNGIYVTNVPDYGTEEVADSAMCAILNLTRKNFQVCTSMLKNKTYPTQEAKGSIRSRGKKFGIIGLGKIGKAVANRAKPFGYHIQFYDPYLEDGLDKAMGISRCHTLKELMETSDIITLHCFLDGNNKHMINKETLSWAKQGAYLVNTARGALVDEKALEEALKSGKIGAAALDVQNIEPYLDGPLMKYPNVMITPHIAFYSEEGWVEMRTKAVKQVKQALLNEKPRNVVNSKFLVNPRNQQ